MLLSNLGERITFEAETKVVSCAHRNVNEIRQNPVIQRDPREHVSNHLRRCLGTYHFLRGAEQAASECKKLEDIRALTPIPLVIA